jgi:putative ABC transport system permease protein
MPTPKGFLVRLRALVRARTVDRELDEEIRFHLEQETKKNVSRGMSPDDARRVALASFGGVRRVQEEHREARGARWLEDFLADARFAFRTLRRSPALTGAAILTLALGVGANTAIFSIVNAVVLRPLPYPQAGRLVMLWEENPEKNWHEQDAAPANYLDWKAQVAAFADAAAYSDGHGTSTLSEEGATPQRIEAADVTGNFFSVLGVRASLGRTFTDAETWANGTRIAVVSHRLWEQRFGGDPRTVGRTVRVDGREVQIVGVMPNGFSFPYEGIDIWTPSGWKPEWREQEFFRRAHWLRVIARLRPGATLEQASAQLQAVASRLKIQYPRTNKFMGAGMTPLHRFLVGDTRKPLLVLLGAVAVLLLIACANVGNLLLVRAADREREVALRLALGAGRGRVVRQALAESLVLSAGGGGLGLALGWLGTRAMAAMQPPRLLRVSHYSLDWTVLLFVLAISIIAGLVFGTLPAAWSGRRAPGDSLKAGGRTGSDSLRMRRWGDLLAISEVALSLVLTIGAGLLLRSFWQLERVDPGFDPRGTITARVDLTGPRYDNRAKILAFFDQLEARARALPGVQDVAMTTDVPLATTGATSDFIAARRAAGDYGTEVLQRVITPSYLQTMRVPLLRGRAFTSADEKDSPLVVLINDALARSYFRGQDPVGQRIALDKVPDSTSTWYTIVGVIGNERQNSLKENTQIEMYFPWLQYTTSSMSLLVRTSGNPALLGPSIRRAVSDIDPALAIASMKTLEAIVGESLVRQRFLMVLLLVFAGVGASLAVVGVYGVLAHLARRRRREMGIRIALGAPITKVRWLVVRHGLRLVWLGLVLGTLGALAATRAVRSMLYGVAATDPITYVGVALLLAVTALAASWAPALMASRADPADTLRMDA